MRRLHCQHESRGADRRSLRRVTDSLCTYAGTRGGGRDEGNRRSRGRSSGLSKPRGTGRGSQAVPRQKTRPPHPVDKRDQDRGVRKAAPAVRAAAAPSLPRGQHHIGRVLHRALPEEPVAQIDVRLPVVPKEDEVVLGVEGGKVAEGNHLLKPDLWGRRWSARRAITGGERVGPRGGRVVNSGFYDPPFVVSLLHCRSKLLCRREEEERGVAGNRDVAQGGTRWKVRGTQKGKAQEAEKGIVNLWRRERKWLEEGTGEEGQREELPPSRAPLPPARNTAWRRDGRRGAAWRAYAPGSSPR